MDFKPGDRLICISHLGNLFTIGKIYTVVQYEHYTGPQWDSVKGDNHSNINRQFRVVNHPTVKSCFKLITEPKTEAEVLDKIQSNFKY